MRHEKCHLIMYASGFIKHTKHSPCPKCLAYTFTEVYHFQATSSIPPRSRLAPRQRCAPMISRATKTKAARSVVPQHAMKCAEARVVGLSPEPINTTAALTKSESGTSCDVSDRGPCIIVHDNYSDDPIPSPVTSTAMAPTVRLQPSDPPSVSHAVDDMFPNDTLSPINGAAVKSAGGTTSLAAILAIFVLARHCA